MEIKVQLPEELFDAQFKQSEFAARVHELAILELVRLKRIHEHEALEILGLERGALLEKMRAVGIAPTEEVFAGIRRELQTAIEARKARLAKK